MLIIGHRGASRAAAENTPEAFELADRYGADGVELDVRLAPDGRLVVRHDPLPSDAGAAGDLPDLDAILDACGDRMLVNVEIKHGDDPRDGPPAEVVAATRAVLDRRGPAHAHRWLISSFAWEVVESCRAEAPRLPTAFLVVDPSDDAVARAAAAGHRALHPFVDATTAATVERCHGVGLAVNVWTCNDPDRLVELARIGVDAVCTDVPDAAIAALARAGEAPAVTPRWGTPG